MLFWITVGTHYSPSLLHAAVPCFQRLMSSFPISPGVIYYVRKLLRQNLDRLRFVRLDGQALIADGTRDLNEVLDSLYPSLGRKIAAIQDLDRLTIVHQTLGTSPVQMAMKSKKPKPKFSRF